MTQMFCIVYYTTAENDKRKHKAHSEAQSTVFGKYSFISE
jgi:hypothetical protein